MKPLIFISFIALSVPSFGQIEQQINSILLKRNFKTFVDFAENYYTEKDGIHIDNGNIREVVTGYQEAMFKISKAYEMNKGVSITANSKLRIITHHNQIIYFYLESKKIKDFPKNYETSCDTTYLYADKLKINDLKKRFEMDFKTALKEEDLFVDTIAVGTTCGHHPGIVTRQQEQILKWVQAKDTSSLFTWLQSATSEKQVYAIKGLHYLSLRGITISKEKKAIVDRVRRKRGTIYTCIPCDTGKSSIADALEDFPL